MPNLLTSSGMAVLLLCRLAAASPQTAEDCAKRIEAAPRTHPRLFLDTVRAEALKRKVAADPVLAEAFSHVKVRRRDRTGGTGQEEEGRAALAWGL